MIRWRVPSIAPGRPAQSPSRGSRPTVSPGRSATDFTARITPSMNDERS